MKKKFKKKLEKIAKSALIPEYKQKKIPKLCPYTDRKTWSCKLGADCAQLDKTKPQYVCGGLDRSVKDKGEEVIKGNIQKIKKWNKAVKKAGVKKLENLKFWSAFGEQFDIVSDFDIETMIKEELEFLLECGFEVGFSHDRGVGYILPDGKDKRGDKLYKIQLWQFYNESFPVKEAGLWEIVEWIRKFVSQEGMSSAEMMARMIRSPKVPKEEKEAYKKILKRKS